MWLDGDVNLFELERIGEHLYVVSVACIWGRLKSVCFVAHSRCPYAENEILKVVPM